MLKYIHGCQCSLPWRLWLICWLLAPISTSLTGLKMVIMKNMLFPWNFSHSRVCDRLLVPKEYHGRRSQSKVMVSGASYIHHNTSLYSLRVPKIGKRSISALFKVKGRLYELIWGTVVLLRFVGHLQWVLAVRMVPHSSEDVTDFRKFWQFALFDLFYGKGKVAWSNFMRIYFKGIF